MKKTVLCLLSAFTLLFAANAYAQKTLSVTPSRNYISVAVSEIAPFTVISVTDDIDVEFRQGPAASASIYGSDNLVELVDVSVLNGVLTVQYQQPVRVRGERRLKVMLSGPELTRVNVQNDGEVEIEGALNAQNLELHAMGLGEISADYVQADSVTLHATGRADIDLSNVQAQTLEAKAEGRGEIEASGTVSSAVLQNFGSGDIDAEHLRADMVSATVHGSGDISCYAAKSLDAHAMGSGKIKYKGYPAALTKTGKAKKIILD